VPVPASEFAKAFGRYKEEAQREPIAITSGFARGSVILRRFRQQPLAPIPAAVRSMLTQRRST
jgi:hypothetical protein